MRSARLLPDLHGATDAALMHCDADDAFTEIVRRHAGVVGRVARSLAGDAADDVAQQTFLAAWLGRRRFDPARGSLPTWLSRIAHNRALDARRAEQRRGRPSPLDAAVDVVCSGEGPEDVAGRHAATGELRSALERIPTEQRTALTLMYYGEMTQVEVQATTHAPLGTVKGRVRLGLHALRRELAAAT